MNSDFSHQPSFLRSPAFFWLMLLFASLSIAFSVARIVKDYAPLSSEFSSFENTGLLDFHNGGYLPALAFRNGVNPYSAEMCEKYVVPRPSAPYSPIVFMTHLPFSFLPLHVADVAYYLFNLSLIGLLAYWSLSMSRAEFHWSTWLGLLGLFAFSRPGHITLYSGYFTAQLVVGTIMALHFAKSKPWLSGIGMLLASGKPTYIIPLAVLMLARKDFRAVAIGISLCAVIAIGGLGWLALDSSFPRVVEGIQHGQAAFHDDDNEDPMNTWTRLDLVGMIAKTIRWKPTDQVYLIAMLGLLVVPCVAIWKFADKETNTGATGLTAMIACLAILLSIYHHSYDGLLVAIPWVGVTFFGQQVLPELSKWQRHSIAVLLAVPAANYASTFKVRELLGLENQAAIWDLITSLNGFCLLCALLIVLWVAFKPGKQLQPQA